MAIASRHPNKLGCGFMGCGDRWTGWFPGICSLILLLMRTTAYPAEGGSDGSLSIHVEPIWLGSNQFHLSVSATNRSPWPLRAGELNVTVSGKAFAWERRGKASASVLSHNGRTVRRLSPDSPTHAADIGLEPSQDLVWQVMTEDWRPGAELRCLVEVRVEETPFECRFLASGRTVPDGTTVTSRPRGTGGEQWDTDAWAMQRPPTMVDLDGDGLSEGIVEWNTGEYLSEHYYQVYGLRPGGIQPLGSFQLFEMPSSSIDLVPQLSGVGGTRAILKIQYSAIGVRYALVDRHGRFAIPIIVAMHDHHIDLDGDGVLEWVFFNKYDEVNHRNRLGDWARGMKVFRWNVSEYRYEPIWPPADGSYQLAGGVIADVDNDGLPEIVALIEVGSEDPPTRQLAIMEWNGREVSILAACDLNASPPMVDVFGLQPTERGALIVLETARGQRGRNTVYEFVGSTIRPWRDPGPDFEASEEGKGLIPVVRREGRRFIPASTPMSR